MAGEHGVALQRPGRPEHRHDPVAEPRREGAAELAHGLAHHLQHRLQALHRPLGVQLRHQFRRADQVREQNGDLFDLGLREVRAAGGGARRGDLEARGCAKIVSAVSTIFCIRGACLTASGANQRKPSAAASAKAPRCKVALAASFATHLIPRCLMRLRCAGSSPYAGSPARQPLADCRATLHPFLRLLMRNLLLVAALHRNSTGATCRASTPAAPCIHLRARVHRRRTLRRPRDRRSGCRPTVPRAHGWRRHPVWRLRAGLGGRRGPMRRARHSSKHRSGLRTARRKPPVVRTRSAAGDGAPHRGGRASKVRIPPEAAVGGHAALIVLLSACASIDQALAWAEGELENLARGLGPCRCAARPSGVNEGGCPIRGSPAVRSSPAAGRPRAPRPSPAARRCPPPRPRRSRRSPGTPPRPPAP